MSAVPDPGPMARLEQVQADQQAPSVIFARLTAEEPETLRQIAKAWGLPRGRFIEWFTTTHAELYDTALKVKADEIAHEALQIADEQKEVIKKDGSAFDPDVGRDKLRVDTRLKLASKFDRSRYGDKQDVNVNVTQWVMRLPTPAANSLEWRQSVERIINPAPTPALAAVPETARAPDAETVI
jgi:hypothetical protein